MDRKEYNREVLYDTKDTNGIKEEDYIDNYVVSDMSEVSRPSLFKGHLFTKKHNTIDENEMINKPKDTIYLTKDERRYYILGVLRASFLVGLAYFIGLSLVIIIFLLL